MPNFFFSQLSLSNVCAHVILHMLPFCNDPDSSLSSFSFTTASRSLASAKDNSVIYIFEVSLVLESFSLSVETLKVFSRQEVKSLSEIAPINSTLETDLYRLIFKLNVTVQCEDGWGTYRAGLLLLLLLGSLQSIGFH